MLLDPRDELLAWRPAGTRFALATIVRTWKSSPNPARAVSAVAKSGKGSGGEGAVHEAAKEVLGASVLPEA